MASFVYDSLNRLVRSNQLKLNETILYEYDINNNIVAEKHYKYTEDEIPVELIIRNDYQYLDENWRDLLTSYNGQDITYDEIGNPLQYLNGMKFTWDSGRKLSEISLDENKINYSYNSSGLRTKKIINGKTTNYLLDGTKIIAEETEGNTIWYSYDANDYVVGFEYNNENFYYGKNIQNDITSIYDNNGNVVVEYLYDDWGNIISISGNQDIGNLNNFRYRSYYYDNESGLYYLQSRYYDSETGRFLNADEKLATFNAFSYCGNNPINYVDYNGQDATITYTIISLIFVGFLLLMVFLQRNNYFQMWSDYFASSISRFVGMLADLGSYITVAIQQKIYTAANDVSIYIADRIRLYQKDPKYQTTHQVHHIVAQTAAAALPARSILAMDDIKINVHNSLNLVAIKTGVHVHLHNSIYYNLVNGYIVNAYYAGKARNNQYYAVVMALNELRIYLLSISAGAPF